MAERAIEQLKDNGVRAELFGSVARRDIRETSDVDLLIFERAGLSNEKIFLLAEKAASELDLSIPIDVVFADEIDEAKLQYMLEDRTPILV